MNRAIRPTDIAPPAAAYEHAMVSEPGCTLLHTSGVVPVLADGTVPVALVDQAAAVWSNLAAILRDGGFAPSDVVSVTTYVVASADSSGEFGADLALVMAARDRFLAGHRAASTLVTVPALARPAWKMEVAVVAAHSRGQARGGADG